MDSRHERPPWAATWRWMLCVALGAVVLGPGLATLLARWVPGLSGQWVLGAALGLFGAMVGTVVGWLWARTKVPR